MRTPCGLKTMKMRGFAGCAVLAALVCGSTAFGAEPYKYPADLPKKSVDFWIHEPGSAHDHLHIKIPKSLLAGSSNPRAELHICKEDGTDHVISHPIVFVEPKKSNEIKRVSRIGYQGQHHSQNEAMEDWMVSLGLQLSLERAFNCYLVVYGKTTVVSREYALKAGGSGSHKQCPSCVSLVQAVHTPSRVSLPPQRAAAGHETPQRTPAGKEPEGMMKVYSRTAYPRLEPVGMVKPGATVAVIAELSPEFKHIRFATSSGKLYEGVVRTSDLATYTGGKASVDRTPNGVRCHGIAPGEWTHDWDAAMAAAQDAGGLVFVNFTGSDWCGWCQLMENKVFSTETWKTWARVSGVNFAWLDFPRNESLLPDGTTRDRNKQLATKYGVAGYPTYLLVDGTGEVVWRGGASTDATPEEFIGGLSRAIMGSGSRSRGAQPAAAGGEDFGR